MTTKQHLTDVNLSDFGTQDLEFDCPKISDFKADFEGCDLSDLSDVNLSDFGALPKDFFTFNLNLD